jgi:uncharacterized protein (TIGR00266 family)
MRTEIRHSPSFAVARCFLDRGQTINVESGAMYAQSLGIQIESKMQGGLFGALKRSIMSGDSFFVSKFSAPHDFDGWVDVAPSYPGDVFAMDVPSNGLVLTRGAWLASDLGVNLDASVNARMFLGGEGIFTVKCTGQGTVVASAYGALDVHSLGPGEGMTVDTGHLVAYEDGMQVNIRKAGTGFINSLTSGEGLVMDIYGPGDVLTQTRNPASFAGFIRSLLPSNN